ncbi:hypothetical protein DENSPDRAFT_833759 [Dentipellis sp. KUC8613]|nr:hypothetical protein DENSPDRAFT_833759 [Dentipellis sp. KUC8613]
MAASPHLADRGDPPPHEKWTNLEDQQPDSMGPAGDISANNGAPVSDDRERAGNDSGNPEYARSSGPGDGVSGKSGPPAYREKQIKPNKVYIGGLPENTRQEDLQNCFGKIGNIINIELKVGYGFVEFDSREAAEESVAKYNEGFFMGNKIRVEISRGGGRYAKYSGDPGACFKCGQMGHWARECGNHSVQSDRRSAPGGDQPLIDRIQPPRDYAPPHPPRDYSYRDDYPPGRYPPRDSRYSYDYPPPRRPVSPPRDYRDYPPPPPRRGEPDDYRMRGPPPPPPPPRYESRAGYYPPEDLPGYARGYPAPPPRDYDRYDRRAPPGDRYAYHAPPPRARTPPPAAPPSRARDDFERPATRDYPPPPPPPSDFRGRPVTPPPARYADYPPRNGAPEGRYRRRSQSPPPRTSTAAYEAYPPAAGYSAPPKGSSRDYPRGGRDAELSSGYRRP